MTFDLEAHLARQRRFSESTFGPGLRTAGVLDHIKRELVEIADKPTDLAEWIDVAILALDGAWRTGATPAQIITALEAKQTKNEARTWPDWRTADPDKAIEHDRTTDAAAGPVDVYLGRPTMIAVYGASDDLVIIKDTTTTSTEFDAIGGAVSVTIDGTVLDLLYGKTTGTWQITLAKTGIDRRGNDHAIRIVEAVDHDDTGTKHTDDHVPASCPGYSDCALVYSFTPITSATVQK
jgi:hypothetical protein